MNAMDDLTHDEAGLRADATLDGMSVRQAREAISERLGLASSEDEGAADDGEAGECDAGDPCTADLGSEGEDADAAGASSSRRDAPVYDAAQSAEHARLVEALLFASAEPMTAPQLSLRLPHGADVVGALEALQQRYESRGVVLQNAGGRYRFVTNPDVAYILTEERVESRKLSRAAMETLAVIAYHQPCTRADIEDVRGVAVSKGSVDQLLEIGWIRLAGRRRDAPGRPVLYATTPEFLAHFNLEGVGDLPGMADLKAAGLLDANLPPGFSVPTPTASAADAGDDEVDDDEGVEAPEFVQDFHGPDAGAGSDASDVRGFDGDAAEDADED